MIRPVAADGTIETGGAFSPIHRPRVVERIRSAASQRIVLIIAPAGYGKSVALRQYLSDIEDSVVRYDVHEENATLLGFVRGLAAALAPITEEALKTVSSAFEKSQGSRTPGTDLAMWMHAHIKTYSGLIAIDDLHFAENEPEISRFLVSLIDRTKGRVRWVIASRSTVDLPVGSWLAYGEMDLNIDEQDLRVTVEEARDIAKAARVSVRDDELHQIVDMTEGWPTALSFAMRSSTRSVDLRNISANTREMVYRYLAEQVYQSLDDDERHLLHFVGFLQEIDLEVLRRAGYSTAKALIERLRDRVAFIYPERPNVYRCHDLFREFLQHQLELTGDHAVTEMRARVARALEDAGSIAGALDGFTAIRAESDILRILEHYGFSLVQQAHGDTVGAALEAISDEARATNALVLALRGMREADAGRLERAESLLQRALQRADDDKTSADLALRLALIRFNRGADVISLVEPLLGQELTDNLFATALSLVTPAYAHAGRYDDATSCFSKAAEWVDKIDADDIRARLLHRMGIAAAALSYPLDEVASLFTRAHALASEIGLFLTSTAALTGLATVYQLYEDDSSKAVWYSQQAVTSALKAGDRYSMQNALVNLINAETKRGNADRIPALEQQFASVAGSDSSKAMYVIASRGMAKAWNGDFAEAHRLMLSIADKPFYDFDLLLYRALDAVYLLAMGDRERSTTLCETVLSSSEAEYAYIHAKHQVEIARLLCAIVYALGGRLTAANRVIQRRPIVDDAVTAGMRNVAVAIYRIAKGQALQPDAHEALQMLTTLGYGGITRIIYRLLERCESPTADEVTLTASERGVLQGLAAGLSPKDIALESGRSIYTVQAHIQNAIKKLGCSGRNEALSLARKRGLLAKD